MLALRRLHECTAGAGGTLSPAEIERLRAAQLEAPGRREAVERARCARRGGMSAVCQATPIAWRASTPFPSVQLPFPASGCFFLCFRLPRLVP